MEETFPPLGSDHRIILDERVDRFPFARLPFFLGVVFVFLLLALGSGWIWQRRVSFSLPQTPITTVLPPAGQSWLKAQTSLPLPTNWKEAMPTSRLSLLMGGTPEHPTWLLAPLWIHPPAGFQTIERHGLYRLSAQTETTSPASPLSLREASAWLKRTPKALGAARWQDLSGPEPVFFAWNEHILVSSLPATVEGELSSQDDLSYLLQNPDFDAAFLASASVNGQGLAPWREALERVSWTDTVAGRSWELVFRAALPANNVFSSVRATERRLLQDGSTSNLLTATSSLPTSSVLRLGEPAAASTDTCPVPTFNPFLRIRGNSLAHFLPVLLPSSTLTLIEIGAFQGQLSVCIRS